MGLSSALGIARSGLTTTAIQTDLISRNIANSNTEGYSRKEADLTTNYTGGVQVNAVDRSVDDMLQRLDRSNASKLASQSTVADGLSAYTDFLGQPSDEMSPAALMSDFQTSLVTLASMPEEGTAQIAVVSAAGQLAEGIQTLSDTLDGISEEVELNIRYDVASVNEALQEITTLNQQILRADEGSTSLAEYQDRMDGLLDTLSGYMDIQTLRSDSGMISVYTGSGAELAVANRSSTVSYNAASGTLWAGDVEITPGATPTAINTGSLGGLFELKQNVLPALNADLDGLAGNLILSMQDAAAFGPGGTGLFTVDGSALATGASFDGLASRITVNSAADQSVGGDPSLLQSGGIATTPAGDSSFIDAMVSALTSEAPVAVSGLGSSMTVSDIATTLVSTHQSLRADAEAATATTQAAGETISASRANFEGVNIDDEMQKLLLVEQSYAANARVMTAISEMMDELINAV